MPRRRAGLPVLLLALPAAIALAAGVFGPMVYVGTWVYADTVSYWEFGGVERHALVGAAALALIAVARRSRGLVVAATFGLWGALAFPFVHSRITVHEGGLLVTSTGSRRGELRAIDLTEARGTFEDGDALVWTFEGDTPHVPSPIAYGGIVYVLKSNAGQLSAYDIVSGERYFGPVRMEGAANIYASPVAAGGYIYFTDREGTVEVVKAGEQYEVAAVNELGERVDASPAISGDELFIRGHEHLFCIARADG